MNGLSPRDRLDLAVFELSLRKAQEWSQLIKSGIDAMRLRIMTLGSRWTLDDHPGIADKFLELTQMYTDLGGFHMPERRDWPTFKSLCSPPEQAMLDSIDILRKYVPVIISRRIDGMPLQRADQIFVLALKDALNHLGTTLDEEIKIIESQPNKKEASNGSQGSVA